MSRKLLFTQTGDERPKCVGRTGPLGEVPWARCPAGLKAASAEYGLSSEQQRAVESADRWWLVECESAEAGRALIAAGSNVAPWIRGVPRVGIPEGSVLASGGKATRSNRRDGE